MRPSSRRHGPGVAPAIAVEHGERPQVHAAPDQPHLDNLAKGVEVGAAREVLDTLRHAGGAGGVVDGDRIQLGGDGVPVVSRRRGGQELLILRPWDAAGPGRLVHHLHKEADAGYRVLELADDRCELRIKDQHFGAGVIEDIGNLPRRETDVDGDKNGADTQRAVVPLQHLRQVGQQEGDAVALRDPGQLERTGQPVHPLAELSVGVGPVLVDDGRFAGMDVGAPLQEGERVQGLVVNAVFHAAPFGAISPLRRAAQRGRILTHGAGLGGRGRAAPTQRGIDAGSLVLNGHRSRPIRKVE